MATIPTLTMNDGRSIPQIGYGCWQIPEAEAPGLVRQAIGAGYRLIDTAAAYGNEAGVGRGIREAEVPRDQIFLTTKIWNDRQGPDAAGAFEESLSKLGLTYVDLYLIHWPCPQRRLFVETWKAMIRLRDEGKIRSLGVSNFTEEHLAVLVGETGVTPAVNQIELHPYFQRRDGRAADKDRGIVTESWSPLGRGQELKDPTIEAIANSHGKTPAQVILRWHTQIGCIAIPKSANPKRIVENISLFDFELTADELDRIAALDRKDGRIGPDPATFC
ncbi:aldo/keto reductase [Methylobacterium aerolatum]|uniref:2,5-diketo-D-gluconate reductase A n=1 Tax=Methylobacterium aerolatum TaxID=418708 RepID=A0ABU0HYN7_9HYPH|nr:aldo/keto reductase [Methylobacterium aerolatum]MDQ0447455.1 2,5-diketo-D-gluconate reductase A [Methylobacterium aerolatum]GJD37440.1 putative oxidoreductase/MSMEI_2347 [Methylobacterium aerolatum]